MCHMHMFTVVNNAVKLSVPLPVWLVLKLYNVFIGHSAKFGSYTVMDLKTNTVIDVQLVQVSGNYTTTTFYTLQLTIFAHVAPFAY